MLCQFYGIGGNRTSEIMTKEEIRTLKELIKDFPEREQELIMRQMENRE